MAICDRQRCKRVAEVAPTLIIPSKVGAAFDARYNYSIMMGLRLCRRCYLQTRAAGYTQDPNVVDFVRNGASARAQRHRRPYEEPDFARTKIECVKLGSDEYRRLAPQLEPKDGSDI